jgi:hypothetical protein
MPPNSIDDATQKRPGDPRQMPAGEVLGMIIGFALILFVVLAVVVGVALFSIDHDDMFPERRPQDRQQPSAGY